jgi:hypothetical protein
MAEGEDAASWMAIRTNTRILNRVGMQGEESMSDAAQVHIYIENGGDRQLVQEILQALHPEFLEKTGLEIVRHDVSDWPPEPFVYAAADLRTRLGIRLSSTNCLTQDGNAYGKRIYLVMLVSEPAAQMPSPAPMGSGSGVPAGIPAAPLNGRPLSEGPAPQTSNPPVNVMSVISLVAGILGLISICISFLIPFILVFCEGLLGLAAVIAGLVGIHGSRKNRERGKEMAIAGLAMGVCALLATCATCIIAGVIWIYALSGTPTPMPFH